jgi:ribosomal protein S15P/S13E
MGGEETNKIMDSQQIKNKIISIYKQTKNMALTGLMLRDLHMIGDIKTETGQSIKEILVCSKIFPYILNDQVVLGIQAYLRIKEHIKSNTRDKHNKRIMSLRINKLFRVIHYEMKKSTYLKTIKPTEFNLELILNKYLAF